MFKIEPDKNWAMLTYKAFDGIRGCLFHGVLVGRKFVLEQAEVDRRVPRVLGTGIDLDHVGVDIVWTA